MINVIRSSISAFESSEREPSFERHFIDTYLATLDSFYSIRYHHYYVIKIMFSLGLIQLKSLCSFCESVLSESRKRKKIEYTDDEAVNLYIDAYNTSIDLKIDNLSLVDIKSFVDMSSRVNVVRRYHDLNYETGEAFMQIMSRTTSISHSDHPELYAYRKYYRLSGIVSSAKKCKAKNKNIGVSLSIITILFRNNLYLLSINAYDELYRAGVISARSTVDLSTIFGRCVIAEDTFKIAANVTKLTRDISFALQDYRA